MKRKAARDYEDLLQVNPFCKSKIKYQYLLASFKCSIPAFDGLLPADHNSRLMTLLYVCSQWHTLAKLRFHNDFTLKLLEYTTVQLGAQMRRFYRDTCSKIPTKESKREAEARASRESKAGKGSRNPGRKPVSLRIFTIKFHYLGDYASIIRWFGTTDSYSSQTVSTLHYLYPIPYHNPSSG
jgi:hypothetical protein